VVKPEDVSAEANEYSHRNEIETLGIENALSSKVTRYSLIILSVANIIKDLSKKYIDIFVRWINHEI
jgi:hypothetical protein